MWKNSFEQSRLKSAVGWRPIRADFSFFTPVGAVVGLGL